MVKVSIRLESGLFKQASFRRSLVQVVTRTTFDLEGEIKRSIQQGKKTGRVYRRSAIKRVVGARTVKGLGLKSAGGKRFVVGFGFHRASAPGESPASDSGGLVNSIKAEAAKSDGRGIHGQLNVNARHGRDLEEGTSRMKPRPYVAPGIKKIEPKFLRDVDQLVAKAVA